MTSQINPIEQAAIASSGNRKLISLVVANSTYLMMPMEAKSESTIPCSSSLLKSTKELLNLTLLRKIGFRCSGNKSYQRSMTRMKLKSH